MPSKFDKDFEFIRGLFNEIDEMKEEIIAQTIEITEMPAPPFMEEKRGELIRQKFIQLGYPVEVDEVGNLIVGTLQPKAIIVSAHLDTVFPADVAIKVVREGQLAKGPGIGDDSQGLSVLLVLARLLKEVQTNVPIVFVATVGEEGRGDLRGVKKLFEREMARQALLFITIDGTGTSRIVAGGVGSLRYRVHFKGPGGHSFGAFGNVNPTYAMGSFLVKLAAHTVPEVPKTTFNIGVIGGGTSINAIPEHIWVDIDLRSEAVDELNKLDEFTKAAIAKAVTEENNRGVGEIRSNLEMVGDRPAAVMDINKDLDETIRYVHSQLNLPVEYSASSTDANVPMNLGIPAISVAGIEVSGRAHTVEEWIDIGETYTLPIKHNLALVYLLTQSFQQY